MVDSQIIKNIIEALINKGINNPSQLATAVGYDQGNMSKIVNDKIKIPAGLRDKLYKKFGILHSYTLKGEGPMFSYGANSPNAVPVIFNREKLNLTIVPVKAFGGFLVGYEDQNYMETLEKTAFPLINGECFMFEVEGFSMMPEYPPGSWVVGTQLEAFSWMQTGKDYVLVTVDGVLIKRFSKITGEYILAESLNPEYEPLSLPLKSVKKVFFIEYNINKPQSKPVKKEPESKDRLDNLEFHMKYVLKFISDEKNYKRSLKHLNRPLSETSICITNASGLLEYVNDEFTRQTGYQANEVIGQKPGDILQRGNSDQDAVKKIREALSARKYFEGEVINYDKTGKEIICKLTITPVIDKSGKLEKFISLAVFSKVNVLKYN